MSVVLINPWSGLPLERAGDRLADARGNTFPVIEGIARIAEAQNYAESFGYQWNRFDSTQLDLDPAGLEASVVRFFGETHWDRQDLADKDVLEVGCGAGRFTRVVLERTGANLYSVDYSSAVAANLRNNGHIAPERLRLFQASIYDLPFPDGSFDKVFCFGVLQHTPDFEASVRALIAKAKPGGEVVVDFYPINGWWTKIHAKYLLRPLLKRLPHERLLRLIERNVDWLLGAHFLLHRLRFGVLTRFLPLCDVRGYFPPGLSPAAVREWAILDTFDMFSPAFDNPQRIEAVASMFRRHGATVTFAGFERLGAYGKAAVVRGVKC